MQNQRRLVADCKHRSLGKAVSVPFPAIRWPKVTAPHVEEINTSFAYSEEVIWWRPSHNSLLWESTCEAGLCFTPLLWEAALQLQSTLRLQHPIIQLHIQHACSYVESNFVSQMNFFFFMKQKWTNMVTKGESEGGWGINQELGINISTLLYIREIINKALLYGTGHSIRYSVINYMRKASGKEWVYA